jgi:host factor-I protein
MFPGNIQETFFDAALHGKKHVTVHLLNGVKLSGKVRSFDKYAVVLESGSLEQLIFKHSISAAFLCRNRHCSECFPGRGNGQPASAVSSQIEKN